MFDTNFTLIKNFQNFKYINQKGIELGPSLWIYAIHGNNMDIIIHHLLFVKEQD